MKETFEEWNNSLLYPHNFEEKQSAKQAWNHQQQKIDKLEEENKNLYKMLKDFGSVQSQLENKLKEFIPPSELFKLTQLTKEE